ncbi:MAG: hypothetical protein B6D41_00915 [Chloroflexi bacterium UTCFX4]|jgi:transcriptional regulator with XRE-family HTH domain|nr:MAG: hypothetical protein B6D41_00915 [Chloroflexi bacterium UTCFX4]
MDIKRIVSERIKLARIERDINQAQLAERMGVNQQMVAKLESGRVSVGIQTLDRVARALNKPISYFVADFEEDNP